MQLDPKGLEAAMTAYGLDVVVDGLEAAIRAYLEAAPSPIPAPGVVMDDALQVALDLLQEKIYGNPARSPGHNAQHYIKHALASLSQPAKGAEGEQP